MFDQLIDLFGQPPGSLIYHFIVLFALEAAFAIALGQWLRERSRATARLTAGVLLLSIFRFALLTAALLAWRGFVPGNVLIPPLERAVDTITVIVLAWLFTTMDDPSILNRNVIPDAAAAVLLGMLLAGFGGTYYYWYFEATGGGVFNRLWIDVVWSVAQSLIAGVGLVGMLTRIKYVGDPVLKGVILVGLGAAPALHLVQPAPGDVPIIIRVGQFAVALMLTAVAYRHVVEQLLHWDAFVPEPATDQTRTALPVVPDIEGQPAPPQLRQETVRAPVPEPAIPVTPSQQPRLLEVVEALQGLLATLEERQIIREAPRVAATALRADICMLAIIDEGSQQAGIVGGYDNIAQTPLPQVVLDLTDHPTLVNAMGRLKQMRLTPERNLRELRDIYEHLGITHEGPAYIQPLVQDDERIGALIVGSPYSERFLSNEERNLLDRLAPLVTQSLINAEKYGDVREELEQVMRSEGARLAELSDEITAATAELNATRRQNEEMKAYIRDLHRQMQGETEQEEQVERLLSEVERLRNMARDTQSLREQYQKLQDKYELLTDQADIMRDEAEQISQLREDNARLIEQAQERGIALRELEEERDRLEEKAQRLEELLEENRQMRREIEQVEARRSTVPDTESTVLRSQLEEARLTAQTEIASLRTRLAQTAISQQEVTVLQEQVSAKAREAVELRTRLAEAHATIDAMRAQGNTTADLDEMHNRLAEQAAEIKRLETETPQPPADSDIVEELEEKTRALEDMRGYMDEVEVALDTLEEQLQHRTEQIDNLQAVLDEAQDHIATIEAGSDDERVEALETELSERTATVRQLRAQVEELRERLDAVDTTSLTGERSEVVASIAQDLRTPMSSIVGYTDLLLQESVGILGSAQRKFLQRVKSNTERMGALLDNLIRMTAIERGEVELAPQRVDATFAIEEAVGGVANQYIEKELTLRLTLEKDLPSLTADRQAVLDIIGHLLSNAALASPVGGEVQLTAASQIADIEVGERVIDARCIYLAVEDSGGGIDDEDIDRVFARKYRADNPLIEGLGDTGVSLSLTQALVEAHYGRIWIDSRKGVGTMFHVLLPLESPSGA